MLVLTRLDLAFVELRRLELGGSVTLRRQKESSSGAVSCEHVQGD